MITVFVIKWAYHDGSRSGVLDKGFLKFEDAEWLYNLLTDSSSSKHFEIIEVEVN